MGYPLPVYYVLCTIYTTLSRFCHPLKPGLYSLPVIPFFLLRIVPLVLVIQRTKLQRFTNWTQKKTPQRLATSGAWPPTL